MALSEFEIKKVKKAAEAFLSIKRPPPHIRKQLDIGYRIDSQSVEIFEIRPDWQDESVILEHSVAKATYVKTRKAWNIFWQRADLKWHRYEPATSVKSIDEFFVTVADDPFACFWG
jgi:hypothetical protein